MHNSESWLKKGPAKNRQAAPRGAAFFSLMLKIDYRNDNTKNERDKY